jgi:hypothetical protein
MRSEFWQRIYQARLRQVYWLAVLLEYILQSRLKYSEGTSPSETCRVRTSEIVSGISSTGKAERIDLAHERDLCADLRLLDVLVSCR